MQVFTGPNQRPIKAWVDGVPVEEGALKQLVNVASLPFIHKHIAVMPDCHFGMGATIGSVIPTKGAIVPAAVGVDIGCGMMALLTELDADELPDNLAGIRSAIEAAVPHGRTDNGGPNDRGRWGGIPPHVADRWDLELAHEFELVGQKLPTVYKANGLNHLGTLGTGNHFIELCLDEADAVWIMLHSGSRGIGNHIGSSYIKKAKREAERWMIKLPDSNLAYFPQGTEHFDNYLFAVAWAQNFARINREIMMRLVCDAIKKEVALPIICPSDIKIIDCHHNYVAQENHFGSNVWVTRKGAVRAREGDLGIIPGSMGAKSYIVRGKGNRDSFNSCSHGAGRAMSRREAKRRFTVEDHEKATDGVECRKDADMIDETPAAYKDIDAVMAAQSDLVEVLHTLKQIVCVKG